MDHRLPLKHLHYMLRHSGIPQRLRVKGDVLFGAHCTEARAIEETQFPLFEADPTVKVVTDSKGWVAARGRP